MAVLGLPPLSHKHGDTGRCDAGHTDRLRAEYLRARVTWATHTRAGAKNLSIRVKFAWPCHTDHKKPCPCICRRNLGVTRNHFRPLDIDRTEFCYIFLESDNLYKNGTNINDA